MCSNMHLGFMFVNGEEIIGHMHKKRACALENIGYEWCMEIFSVT